MLHLDTRPSRSPPTHPVDTHHPRVATTASRIFVSVRRSFTPPSSPRRKDAESPLRRPAPLVRAQRAAMYSTPEERRTHTPSRAARLDSRPTIEQIAMGLHVSRTPHLRPVPAPPLQPVSVPSPSRRSQTTPVRPRVAPDTTHDASTSSSHCRTRHSLPPPPSRSSLKKTTTPSLSTLTQSPQQSPSSAVSPLAPGPVPQAPSRPLSSLRVRISRFFPGYRPLSLPSSLGRASSITSSASDSTRSATPRKAVRFSTSVLAIDEQS